MKRLAEDVRMLDYWLEKLNDGVLVHPDLGKIAVDHLWKFLGTYHANSLLPIENDERRRLEAALDYLDKVFRGQAPMTIQADIYCRHVYSSMRRIADTAGEIFRET